MTPLSPSEKRFFAARGRKKKFSALPAKNQEAKELPKLELGGGKLSSAYLISLCTIGGRSLKAIFNFRNLQPPINVPLFVS
jgi:hypothetical protein